MKQLNLPEYSFRIIRKGETDLILDSIRKKYVRLTPEEWVRQNFVQYLVHEGKYPAGLIGIEVMFKLNKLRKRADILVHNRKGEPVMLVECKSDEVRLDDKVNDQIVEYNMNYRIPYLVITNGMSHYAVKITDYDTHQFEYLLTIPFYEDLQA